jgi:hypothetical protein
MAMAMRVAGDKEGKGGKGNGDSDKSGGQATAMAKKRAMVTAMRVAGKQGQWRQRGQWQLQWG